LALNQISHAPPFSRFLTGVRRLAYHLLSLETLLVMFVFGAHLKLVIPSPPLLPETVFYGLLSIVVGAWIILRQGIYLRGIPVFAAGLVFMGWMLASYGWTPSRVVARESLVFILGVNLWAIFAAACIVAESRERVLRLLMLLMVCATVLSIYGAYIELVHGSFRFYRGPEGDWPVRTYLAWGNIVGPGAAVALGLVIYTRLGTLKNTLAILVLATCMYFMLFLGPRGPLVGLSLAMLAVLLINLPRVRDGRIELPVAEFLSFLVIIAAVGYVSYLIASDQTTATLNRFVKLWEASQDPLQRTGANRFDYYAGAYRAWLEAPIFGHGLSGFAIYFCGREDSGCHAHNVVLQALTDFGLIGLILYLTFVWMACRHLSLRNLRQDPLLTTLLLPCCTILIYAMVAANLPTDHRVFFFLGLLALRPPSDEADEIDVADQDDQS